MKYRVKIIEVEDNGFIIATPNKGLAIILFKEEITKFFNRAMKVNPDITNLNWETFIKAGPASQSAVIIIFLKHKDRKDDSFRTYEPKPPKEVFDGKLNNHMSMGLKVEGVSEGVKLDLIKDKICLT